MRSTRMPSLTHQAEQAREAGGRARGDEGLTIIATDGLRKAMLAEELFEDFPGLNALGRPKRRAGEQESRGSVHHGERVNEGAIAQCGTGL